MAGQVTEPISQKERERKLFLLFCFSCRVDIRSATDRVLERAEALLPGLLTTLWSQMWALLRSELLTREFLHERKIGINFWTSCFWLPVFDLNYKNVLWCSCDCNNMVLRRPKHTSWFCYQTIMQWVVVVVKYFVVGIDRKQVTFLQWDMQHQIVGFLINSEVKCLYRVSSAIKCLATIYQ